MILTRLLALIIITTVATLAACGGDDDGNSASPSTSSDASPSVGGGTVSDDAYFDELTATFNDLVPDSDALDDFRAAAFDSSLTDEQRIANAKEFASRYESYARDAHDRVLAITPGSSLGGEHGALVDALGDLITLGEDLAGAIDETPLTTDQQFGDLFFDLEGQSLELRVRDACFRIQQVAASVGIEAGFVCPR